MPNAPVRASAHLNPLAARASHDLPLFLLAVLTNTISLLPQVRSRFRASLNPSIERGCAR